MLSVRREVWAVVAVAWAALPAAAAERYFAAVFAVQRRDMNLAKDAHSFAVFVRATETHGMTVLEPCTISWLPETGKVKVYRMRPERGKNFGLDESLRLAAEQGGHVSMWGFYEIEGELYARAVAQAERLEGGEVLYKAMDTGFAPGRVSNCMHALSDLVRQPPRRRMSSPGWGRHASHTIALWLSQHMMDSGQTHDWLTGPLGLDGYRIARRSLEDRRSVGGWLFGPP